VAFAIRNALVDYPGSWSVLVDQDLIGGWWLVTLSAEGFHQSVLVPPREQSPDDIASVVVETIGVRTHPLRFVRHALDLPAARRCRRDRRRA
jgi:hypothetical protein